MAGDLIREVRRAALIQMKQDRDLLALLPAASMYPSTTPANVPWPFTRLDGFVSTSLDGSCYAGATVTFIGHAFARTRVQGGDEIETAEDFAGRIGSALKAALHRRRLPIGNASARYLVRSSRLVRDADEASAYHAILSVEARVLAA